MWRRNVRTDGIEGEEMEGDMVRERREQNQVSARKESSKVRYSPPTFSHGESLHPSLHKIRLLIP